MVRKTLQILVAASSLVMANNIAVTYHPLEPLKEKLQAVKELQKQGNLSESQRKEAETLLSQADSVIKTSSKCATIAIKFPLDMECLRFHEETYPMFENRLFELVGSLKLNSVKATDQTNMGKLADACASSLFPDPFRIEDIITIDGDVALKPSENNTILAHYILTLGVDQNKRAAIQKHLSRWSDACSFAVASDNGFTPLFEKLAKGLNFSGKGLFKFSNGEISVSLDKKTDFSYYINNRYIFGTSLQDETPILSFNNVGSVKFNDIAGARWKNYAAFNADELKRRGFISKVNRGERTAPKRTVRKFKNMPFTKSVVIGNQEWFAMDYGVKNWEFALKSCPDGWHLPSEQEWRELLDFAKANSNGTSVSASLMATHGWPTLQGTDLYGFSAMGSYSPGYDECATFWTSTKKKIDEALSVNICKEVSIVPKSIVNPLRIRCVREFLPQANGNR